MSADFREHERKDPDEPAETIYVGQPFFGPTVLTEDDTSVERHFGLEDEETSRD